MVSIKLDQKREFRNALKEARKSINDFTIPFGLMAQSFFRSNKSIFLLKGPGKYDDLSPSTKKTKSRILGQVYPVMKFSGVLEQSLTNPSDSGAVNLVINKNILMLGTSVTSEKGAPYPHFLQDGTKFMPARPCVLLGVEQVSTPQINMRLKAWVKMMNDFVDQSLGVVGEVR